MAVEWLWEAGRMAVREELFGEDGLTDTSNKGILPVLDAG